MDPATAAETRTKARRVQEEQDDRLDMDLFLSRAKDMTQEELIEFLGFVLRTAQDATSVYDLNEAIRGGVLGSYFRDAPYPVLSQIALNLPFRSLAPFCATNRGAAEICQSEYFWKRRLERDFGITRSGASTWQRAYWLASNNPPQGRVYFMVGDAVFSYQLDTVGGEFECEGCWLAAHKWFPTQSVDGVTAVHFHGDSGYPVVFVQRDDSDENEYVREDGFFVLVEDIDDHVFIFIFQAAVVDEFNEVTYGADAYRDWVQRCGWDETSSLLVCPSDMDAALNVQASYARALDLYSMLVQYRPASRVDEP